MKLAFIIILNYLVGSIPFAYIAGKVLKGIDIREYGSGNVGATNAFRVLGTGPGIFVFAADTLKGVFGVYLAKMFLADLWLVVAASLAVIIGHSYSVFLGFKGGRGVATGAGIILSLSPRVLLLALILFVIIVLTTKYVSLGSITAAFSLPILMFIFNEPAPIKLLGFAAAVLVIYRHKPNIKRLLEGTESKITDRFR
ncbi:MAG TPA: acyl-phosphate glycerol 3-phosphate acyltransferase [Peptococcaceae bacterium]|nr:MAG: Glycerol-3-phosphate acyltransferase [Clostridia bacterium 41_269]HBT20524.1 acyl-phosphate glycerol 3-phosphate acyltransferase [Peptococcaceae bacterium]